MSCAIGVVDGRGDVEALFGGIGRRGSARGGISVVDRGGVEE